MKTKTRLLATFLCAALAVAFTHPAAAAPGDVDPGFDPGLGGEVFGTALQADGKIVITYLSGNSVARINANGTLDAGFNPPAPNVNLLYSAAVQVDGKILLGGLFTTLDGVTRNRIARLNANGTLDPGFNPNANSTVNIATVQADWKNSHWGLIHHRGHRGGAQPRRAAQCLWHAGRL